MCTDPRDNSPTAQTADVPSNQRRTEYVNDAREVEHLVDQIATAIVRDFTSVAELALIGIRSRGDELARRLQSKLADGLGSAPPCGSLDITLYRDDFDSLREQPIVGSTEIPFSLEGRVIILVDDVLFTGRTVRAALDELLDLGRPARVVLAVLVDRGWRELPIAPDIVGQTLATEHDDDVQVFLREIDGRDAIVVHRSSGACRDG